VRGSRTCSPQRSTASARVGSLCPLNPHAHRPDQVGGRSDALAGLGYLDPIGADHENVSVSKKEIDQYLATLDEPKTATLAQLRDTIVAIVPNAEQCISYGMPAFKLRGKTIAGFAAFKSHLSYLPHSGSVIPQLAKETEGYTKTKGSLHFPVDKPLPKTLVKKLLDARMTEAFGPRR
jgi:uncharacterized protein YdhG (YjbR/CyaY superfamily)